jgi:osmotically-inducible protein OsmY
MELEMEMDQRSGVDANEVMEAARGRLRETAHRALQGVSCEYDAGVLVLRGRLSSFYQKQLAQEAVVGLAGVAQVVNRTEVIAVPA